MRNKNFKNIGNVAISEIALCDTTIGLYIPIEKMSENIRREYEKCEKYLTDTKIKSKILIISFDSLSIIITSFLFFLSSLTFKASYFFHFNAFTFMSTASWANIFDNTNITTYRISIYWMVNRTITYI